MTHPSATPQLTLCRGIANSDLDMVREALNNGADPNLGPLGEQSYHPLQRAMERVMEGTGYPVDIVRCLLEAGADPRRNSGAYMNARGRGRDIGLIAYLVGNQTDDRVDKACSCLDILLAHWPKTHAWHEILLDDGMPVLHWAARHLHVKPVVVLLEHGCPVDNRDEVGNTALVWARSGEVAKTLLAWGANPHAYNYNHKTVLWNAAGSGHREVWKDTIHAVLDAEPDLSKEIRLMELARRVKKRIGDWEPHWKTDDLDALERLHAALVRQKLQRKVKRKTPQAEPEISSKPSLRM